MATYTTPEARRAKQTAVISIVVPAFNEQNNLRPLYQSVRAALVGAGWTFELVVVDDGSTDATLAVAKDLCAEDARVRYVSLSRNFGHQAALLAGMDHARGDAVISMDCDLQHPSDILPRMLESWQAGYDVVHTFKRSDRSAGLVRRLTAQLFYGTFRRLSGLPLNFGQSDFRLLDAHVARQLCRLPEYQKFLRGLVSWMGFRQTLIEYDVVPRLHGSPTYTFKGRLRFHVDAIFSFSAIPLRFFTIFGMLICVPAGLYGAFALIQGLYAFVFHYPSSIVRGWASLAVFVTFLGGVQLIGIGMLGEYLARVFEQTKARPIYLVSETSSATRNALAADQAIVTSDAEGVAAGADSMHA